VANRPQQSPLKQIRNGERIRQKIHPIRAGAVQSKGGEEFDAALASEKRINFSTQIDKWRAYEPGLAARPRSSPLRPPPPR